MTKEKVLDWLKKTGFPLEMETATAFRTAGFDVRQSATLLDIQMEKSREIDVLATDPDPIGIIQISYVLECKSSSKPWIVFIADDVLSNYNRLLAFGMSSDTAREHLVDKIASPLVGPFIQRHARGGYAFRQALCNGSDTAYIAAIGAMKACYGLVRENKENVFSRLAFAFPVIVVDSPLFECSLDQNRELALEEVSNSEFLFSTHIPNYVGCCIKVITREHLTAFARFAKEQSNAIRSELKDVENNMISAKK